MSQEEKVSSLRRMARVMYAILQTQGEWFTLSSMVRKCDMFPSTMHRYLQCLIEEDMLEHDKDTMRYRLTKKMKNLLLAQGLRLIHKPLEEGEGTA